MNLNISDSQPKDFYYIKIPTKDEKINNRGQQLFLYVKKRLRGKKIVL